MHAKSYALKFPRSCGDTSFRELRCADKLRSLDLLAELNGTSWDSASLPIKQAHCRRTVQHEV